MPILAKIKEQALKLNDFLKKMEQMPMRGFQGDFYDDDDSKPAPRAPRKNNVKVEDLRPPKVSEKPKPSE